MRNEPVEFGMMFKGFEKFVPLMVIGLIQSIPAVIGQVIRFSVDMGQLGINAGRGSGDFDFFMASDQDVAIASGIMIVAVVVAIVFIIFAILWWMIFFFAIPLAMEHDLGAIDAIKLSAQASMANIGGLIVMMILSFLVALLGVLLCGIGVILISMPIIYIANAFVYRQVFPFVDQQFNMTPPPPASYGDFGRGMA